MPTKDETLAHLEVTQHRDRVERAMDHVERAMDLLGGTDELKDQVFQGRQFANSLMKKARELDEREARFGSRDA